MNLDLAPANPAQWAENESTGYRHIGIMSEGNKIFAITSHKVDGVWTSNVVPMGYSYRKDEISNLVELFNTTVIELMTFIERDEEISYDCIMEFLEHWQ